MLNVAIGHSADIDLEQAVSEVTGQIKRVFGDSSPAAGLLHVADNLDHAYVISELRRIFPGIKLAGCTSAGEASSVLGFQEDSVLLVAFSSADLGFAVGIGRNPSEDAERAAREAYAQVKEALGDQEPRLCFMYTGSVHAKPDVALRSLAKATKCEVAIIGGSAASYPPGGNTFLFFNDEVLVDALILLAVGGDLEIAVSSETSWAPVGKPGRVTKAEGNLIREIDGAPALDFYTDRLGENAEVFAGAPLGILDADGGLTVRAPLLVDRENRTMRFAGGIREGDTVQILYASFDDVHRGASAVIEKTMTGFPEGDPALVFFCSCAVRKMYLALDVSTEVEQIKDKIETGVPVAGFYGYGEIGSQSLSTPAMYHNQAIVAVALR